MKRGDIIGWAGIGLFMVLLANFLLGYGTRWEFGAWGMPSTLLDETGTRHPDGTPVEDVTLALARSGYEQQAYWAVLLLILCLALWVLYEARRLYRTLKRLHETEESNG